MDELLVVAKKSPATQKPENKRIELLDTFRFIAILMVILYHYFYSKVADNVYPYGSQYSHLFKHGNFGVQLFYMISGFVIFMTIERCATFREFMIKRIIRLWPALALCSVLCFIGMRVIDPGNSLPTLQRETTAFLPSLTFIDPFIWSKVMGEQIKYIDKAHWSLLVEMKFYIVFGALYFLNKKNVFKHWLLLTALITAVHFVHRMVPNTPLGYLVRFDVGVHFGNHLVFFTLGIIAYLLYSKRDFNRTTAILSSLVVLFQLYTFMHGQYTKLLIVLAFILLFVLFVYRPNLLFFIKLPFFSAIGLVSYPLYLMHNNLGTALINKLSNYFNAYGIYDLLIVVGVIIFMVLLSIAIDKYYDRYMQKSLKKLFFGAPKPLATLKRFKNETSLN